MKKLTVEDILAGAAYAVDHPEKYDQGRWCGTACCVLGHARALVGSDQLDRGLRDDEFSPTNKKESMIRDMLPWTHEDTAALLPHVGDDGVLRVPAEGIGLFGAGAHVGQGAIVERGAIVGPDAHVGQGVRVRRGEVYE